MAPSPSRPPDGPTDDAPAATDARDLPARPRGLPSPRSTDADDEVLRGEIVEGLDADAALDAEIVDLRSRAARTNAESDDEGDDADDREAAEEDAGDDVLEGEVLEGDIVDGAFDAERFEHAGEPTQVGARSPSADLAPLDPLQAYMRDVQRHALLSPEETHDLAVRYVETGDVDAARRLVTANLRLVVKIAYDYRRAYRNILDLIQEGNIGLMQAVKKYDPYKGVRLSSYSAWWIRAYILRFVLNNWRLVKLGTTQAQRKLFFNLRKEKARLSAMGIEPTPETIARNLDVPTEEVVHMDRRLGAGDLSLDAPVGHGDDAALTTRIDRMPAEGALSDEALAHAELQGLLAEKIHEFGATLTGKDAIIFRERLMAEEPKTLQELGDLFGVSRERVRQIEKRLQGKIRSYLEAHVESSALR